LRFYETTIVLSSHADEAATEHEIEKVNQTVAGAQGRMVTTQTWGVKRMAYPISKHTQACYVHFVYQAPPSVPGKLESMFRINENILRHLTVLVEGPLTSKRGVEQATQAAHAAPEAPRPAEPEPAEASPAADTGGTTVGVGPETEPPK
jgi:small subunit ribosomal protein S6